MSRGDIREEDAKGKHTTTRRSLLALPSGGLILDTPGMRELQLADCQQGIASTFSDVEAFAIQCRFADCKHSNEPGCAVQAAIESGELETRRLANYLKLKHEEALNSQTLAQRRSKEKSFTKFVRYSLKESHRFKGRD